MNGKGLDRRTLLKAAVALPLVLLRPQWLPELRAAEKNGAGAGAGNRERLLLLVELHGGNDGLNTLIPYFVLFYLSMRSLEISFWLTLPLTILTAGFMVRTFTAHFE